VISGEASKYEAGVDKVGRSVVGSVQSSMAAVSS
jgi:hypothetical protein